MGSVPPDWVSADGAVLTNTKIRRAKKPMMKSSFQMEISSKEKAPEDKESLEPSKGHLLAIPLHDTLQRVRGYAVRFTGS
jgi:hypothetical protein